jgi:hypothetical protein
LRRETAQFEYRLGGKSVSRRGSITEAINSFELILKVVNCGEEFKKIFEKKIIAKFV